MNFLDNVPLASLLVVIVTVTMCVLLLIDNITYDQFKEFLIGVGALSGGAGVLGYARNGAGRGVARPR